MGALVGTDAWTAALLLLTSTAAGFVDAVAGGGGLLLVPALFLALPDAPVPVILGTNKLTSVTGTSLAAWKLARATDLPRRQLLLALLCAAAGSVGGVQLALRLPSTLLRPLMLGLLALVLLIVVLRPSLGAHHQPKPGSRTTPTIALVSAGLGIYDGFFGPGTGVLLIFAFVSLLGYDFLRASALAKSANFGSNLSAVVLFAAHGQALPGLAALLIVGNMAGGYLGAHLAIAKGNLWVRRVFLLVVLGLLGRLAWQTFGA